jgi:DHHC palmitoyltransferase
VFGPHWFGPPFILFIILVSSYYIIYERCYRRHWYLTTAICALLCCSTVFYLLNTAYRDPGVITKNSLPINHDDPESIPRSYRYCDTCQYYQPSHAAHCPDCNVCVAGFDHHCVWMSICIGVGNYKVKANERRADMCFTYFL